MDAAPLVVDGFVFIPVGPAPFGHSRFILTLSTLVTVVVPVGPEPLLLANLGDGSENRSGID